jgi:hypothetical protein
MNFIVPRKIVTLALAVTRIAEAKRIIAAQRVSIANLKTSGQPTAEAEKTLEMLESALIHLEEHAHKLREQHDARIGETKKRRYRRPRPDRP